jgi:hypothetical protein
MRHAFPSRTFNVVNEGLHAGVHGISRHVVANFKQTILHTKCYVQGTGVLTGTSNVLLCAQKAKSQRTARATKSGTSTFPVSITSGTSACELPGIKQCKEGQI